MPEQNLASITTRECIKRVLVVVYLASNHLATSTTVIMFKSTYIYI